MKTVIEKPPFFLKKQSIIWIVLLALLAGLVSTMPMMFIVAFLLAISVYFFYPINTKHFVIFIALVIFIDISFITIQGSYIRIYQVLFLALFIKYILEFSMHKQKLAHIPLFLLLNLWVLSYFLSYGHLISIKDFWVTVIGQLFLNVFYFIVVQVIQSQDLSFYRKVIKSMILSGFFVAVIGIFQWIGFFAGTDIGVSHYESIGIPRPSSFAHEPDWYGLFSAYTFIWFLALYIKKDILLFSNQFVFIGLLVSFMGVFLSMARASMVAVAAAIIFLFLLTHSVKVIKLSFISGLFTVIVLLGLFLVDSTMVINVYNRINPWTSTETDSGAANSRMGSIQLMLDTIPQHPVVGNGSGGMALLSSLEENQRKYAGGGELNAGKGNANIFLTVLFDTGMVGFSIFAIILIKIIGMLKSFFNQNDFISLGLSGASFALLIDFNFNNGFRMGFVWFHLALLTSYYLLKKRELNRIASG